MDFSWPEAYLTYQQSVTDFATAELGAQHLNNDAQQQFPRQDWERCAAFGIQALALPAAYGGPLEKVDFLRAILAMEALGRGCADNGLAFALNAQMWTVMTPILHFGNAAQKERYLPAMAQGRSIGAHALTEPDAGSDVMSMQLSARKTDTGYVLNGTKALITLGPIADVVLVFANARPERGSWGISAFLVERGTPGFSSSEKMSKMGMRSIPFGSLTFTDCHVPASSLLGTEGLGFSIMNHSLEYDRCAILASQLGAMERQLETAIAFARQRKQFGQAIGGFQAVSHRIADMKLRLETSRLLLYKTAWLKQQGKAARLEAALLKLQLSEAFVASSLDAIRTHGGAGYLHDYGVEKDLRDAVGGVLYAGTSDIQRNIIAKLLGL
ncbi:acyl-CoA dehydrogenase family protein [Neolewinella lacunae]|uniref:Acyl-CoA dehydrogenase family protein n=1 Tax=Neolewinella lacunae TaxID=1517758 RepID=A0A923T827_9BACT|nr:acyl-CoA dehydrogenase family protein [Neolewinella lacunae]MBC6994134.1 acyl-CoA dehydrogenase family protein [Neolewinella lacunae]MDN3636717.1 acyl-CoA dehydrogenase family protein [Neolewinella lacunae]